MATRQIREWSAEDSAPVVRRRRCPCCWPFSLPCPSGGGIAMRRTVMEMMSASWRRVDWLGLCLCVLVTACSTAPALSAPTPTASEPTQVAAITAYHGHTSTVFAVAWSPDGTRIASGSNDSTVQIWDARSGHRLVLYTGHTGTVYTVAWSPNGTRIASGSDDSTVQVWDARSGQHLLTSPGHAAPVRAVAWSPDGTRIASASQDGTVQVWDAASGHHLLTYRGQTAPIWAVAWSQTGVYLASATGNTSEEHPRETVQVWNATTGHLLVSYLVPSSTAYADGTLSVAWSPDGMHIASGGADTIVHLW